MQSVRHKKVIDLYLKHIDYFTAPLLRSKQYQSFLHTNPIAKEIAEKFVGVTNKLGYDHFLDAKQSRSPASAFRYPHLVNEEIFKIERALALALVGKFIDTYQPNDIGGLAVGDKKALEDFFDKNPALLQFIHENEREIESASKEWANEMDRYKQSILNQAYESFTNQLSKYKTSESEKNKLLNAFKDHCSKLDNHFPELNYAQKLKTISQNQLLPLSKVEHISMSLSIQLARNKQSNMAKTYLADPELNKIIQKQIDLIDIKLDSVKYKKAFDHAVQDGIQLYLAEKKNEAIAPSPAANLFVTKNIPSFGSLTNKDKNISGEGSPAEGMLRNIPEIKTMLDTMNFSKNNDDWKKEQAHLNLFIKKTKELSNLHSSSLEFVTAVGAEFQRLKKIMTNSSSGAKNTSLIEKDLENWNSQIEIAFFKLIDENKFKR